MTTRVETDHTPREVPPLEFAPPLVGVRRTADGGYLLESPTPLAEYERSAGEWLRRWTREAPDRLFLAERGSDGAWRNVTYGEAGARAAAIAQALLDRELGPERPLMILSSNGIDHALLMLGGFLAGVPVVPVSVAYSLLSRDYAKLTYIAELVRPGLMYAAHGEAFAAALAALDLRELEVVVSAAPPPRVRATPFAELTATRPTGVVERAFASVGPDTVAKILFTSGSTGFPKGVINTHRMLCANQQMVTQAFPWAARTPPVLVDWLPWNHTFGGNYNLNFVLKSGGTMYIDGGKPAPQLIEQTVRNLAEVSPTLYFNVPAGYGMLLPYLERDEALRRTFFRRLQMVFYGGAALSQDLWDRLEALSLATVGRRVFLASGWGSTETAPLATASHFPTERAGVIGLPIPGVTIKLVPSGAKLEIRVKGPNVTPGYLHRPDLTAEAFDEEGFYRIGDAGRFVDPADPSKGLLFDGRIAEDFKLSTGTWVHVGGLRVAALAALSPAVQDATVAGHDRDYPALLAWPSEAGCRSICQHPGGHDSLGSLVRCEHVREHVRRALAAHNAAQPGLSTRVGRVLLLADPPSIDAGEITDKGYINQRRSLQLRAALVERLYAEPPDPEVIVAG